MDQVFFTYLLANETRDRFFAGVTSDLVFAVNTHKKGLADPYTRDFTVDRLVWYRPVHNLIDALRHKRQLRDLSDVSKQVLVELENPEWQDLLEENEIALTA